LRRASRRILERHGTDMLGFVRWFDILASTRKGRAVARVDERPEAGRGDARLALDWLRAVVAPLVGLVVATVLWPYLELPSVNREGIVGPLTIAGRNPLDNLVRYAVFVGLPVVAFWAAGGARAAARALRPPARAGEQPLLFAAVAGAIGIWGLAAFANRIASFSLVPLDLFHDGELLVPAFVARRGGGLWTGSFFVHGLVYDVVATELGWRVLGESVGGMRLAHHVWSAAVAPAVAVFAVAMGWIARAALGSGAAAVVMAAAFLPYAWGEHRLHYFDARDVWPLLVLPIGFSAVTRGSTLLAGVFGACVVLAPLVTIERGVYVLVAGAVTLGVYGTFRATRWQAVRLAGSCGLGMAIAIAAAIGLLGSAEVGAFAENFWHWARFKEAMDGYVYPAPFTGDVVIFTLPMLLIAGLGGMAVVAATLARDRSRDVATGSPTACRQAAVLAGIAAVAAAYFRSALGRPDVGHVLYAASFAYVGAALVAAWLLAPRWSAGVRWVVLAPLVWLAGAQLHQAAPVSWEAVADRMVASARVPDDDLLATPEREALGALRAAVAADRCAFVYPSWPAWYYLLRKPPCSRFFLTWFAARPAFQAEVVAALERERPRVILLASPAERYGEQDGIPRERRFPVLDAYLRRHYAPAEVVGGWQLGRRRDSGAAMGSPPG
jgi:hypothetical protein